MHTRASLIVQSGKALTALALVVVCASTAHGQDPSGTPDTPPDLSTAQSRAAGRPEDRPGVRGVRVSAEGHRSAVVCDDRHRRTDPPLRIPDARRRAAERTRLLRHLRQELQLRRCARVLAAGRLQRARAAAHRRPSPERQRVRQRAHRQRVPARYRVDRASRDHQGPELVALRHERLLRGDQRDHARHATAARDRARRRAQQLRHRPGARQLRSSLRE